MLGVQTIFERYEKKYLLTPVQHTALCEALYGRMQADPYGRYSVCNLYFDTPDYRLIRASLAGPVYKEKLRLRSYGVPAPDGAVFLELKKKFQGVVYKRRVCMRVPQARDYLESGARAREDSQILDEIDWFRQFYRPQPRVFISYDRTALTDGADDGLRMTFDTNLRWRDTVLDLAKGDWGAPLLTDGSILMEVKFPNAMPLRLARLLGELGASPVSFSKYGVCYQRFLSQKPQETGGIHCA